MAKPYRSKIKYRLREVPISSIEVWRDVQARGLDRDGVAELAKSIRAEGLQNPPLVQKDGKKYKLLSGQRRLAALKRLRAKTIPVHVLTAKTAYDPENAKAASVIENVHRKNMNTRELAESCIILAESNTQAKAAKLLGVSVPTFKKLHGYAGVPDRLKDLVPGSISRNEAMRLHVSRMSTDKAVRIVERVSHLQPPLRRQYIRIVSDNPDMRHDAVLRRAKKSRSTQKIPLVLPRASATRLERHAERLGVEPDRLAKKIVTDWLKKHK